MKHIHHKLACSFALGLGLAAFANTPSNSNQHVATRNKSEVTFNMLDEALRAERRSCKLLIPNTQLRKLVYSKFAALFETRRAENKNVELSDLLNFSHLLYTADYQSQGLSTMLTAKDGVRGFEESLRAPSLADFEARLAKESSGLLQKPDTTYGLLKVPGWLAKRRIQELEAIRNLAATDSMAAVKSCGADIMFQETPQVLAAKLKEISSCQIGQELQCLPQWLALCSSFNLDLYHGMNLDYFSRSVNERKERYQTQPATAPCIESLLEIVRQKDEQLAEKLQAEVNGKKARRSESSRTAQRKPLEQVRQQTREREEASHRSENSRRENGEARNLSGQRSRMRSTASTEGSPEKTRELLRIAQKNYDRGWAINANGAKVNRHGYCYVFVKRALLEAGLVDRYLKGNSAYQAGPYLLEQGFKKLSITDPDEAPLGAVVVYRSWYYDKRGRKRYSHGHIEFRSKKGFLSNVDNRVPATAYRSGKHYEVTGIYVKN